LQLDRRAFLDQMLLVLGLGYPNLQRTVLANLPTGISPIRFRNIASTAGLNFVLQNHATQEKHEIETMLGGVAAFDYDGDGLTDIYFTNGATIPSLEKDSPKYFNRLYRNEGGMKFVDVTMQAGVQGTGYSMGAAAGDYDNDGHVDLFVAGVYRNILYHNLGNGRFEDVTAHAGIKSNLWSVAAGWFDYDNDGWLDLLVVNYTSHPLSFDRFCGDPARNIRMYCDPQYLGGLSNTLYHNNRDGTFTDVTSEAGLAKHIGKGMSVAFADYDHDGFMDAFVTNDSVPNFLFHNRGNGTFDEVGLLAGVALQNNGETVSSMGADFRDYDNDGLPDIFITALFGETFPLFRNLGKGMFEDVTSSSGLGTLTSSRSGYSNGIFDFNNDGWKDIFTANSHVDDNIELFMATHYKLPNSVFVNMGDGTFQDMSGEAGLDLVPPRAHRGAAFADFNNDGKIDVVVSAICSPAELWENVSDDANNWLLIKLTGNKSNRDGIGAVIEVDGQYNHMTTAVGYASSSHFGIHFGLGKKRKASRIEIRWPSGIVQVLRDVPANQILTIDEPTH
jgi:enediyne biosynthesis protein E4